MGFSRLSPELKQKKHVTLETTFISEYLPAAPENYIKVYLMGLAMADSPDSELESIALALNIPPSSCMDAFLYWQAQGIVNVSLDPAGVEFLPVVPYSRRIKKYSKEKYKTFNDQLHLMIKDRIINPPEYEEYYNLMESYHIEIEAMLTIIGYCIRLKGPDVGCPYIMAVAKNLASHGYTDFHRETEKLGEYDLYDADLKAVLKALSLKRNADHNDRSMFLKWKSEYGFSLETIINIAKKVKKGGIQTLDTLLIRYYENRLYTVKEIDAFNKNRDKLFDITRAVLKILGLRYEQLDYIIETYVSGWLSMGFTEDALFRIADYCFRHGIRDLDGMNNTAAKFYKQGLISSEAIDGFINDALKTDNEIKKLFSAMGISHLVTPRDRDFYKTWVLSWETPDALIAYAAEISKTKANPMAYMNSVLSSFYNKNIKTLEDAKKSAPKNTEKSNDNSFISRTLSAEELNAMFHQLDDDEI